MEFCLQTTIQFNDIELSIYLYIYNYKQERQIYYSNIRKGAIYNEK